MECGVSMWVVSYVLYWNGLYRLCSFVSWYDNWYSVCCFVEFVILWLCEVGIVSGEECYLWEVVYVSGILVNGINWIGRLLRFSVNWSNYELVFGKLLGN